MSLDRSLKAANSLVRHRNVLTRAERLIKLAEDEKWDPTKSVYGLPKVGHRKMAVTKSPSKEDAAAAVAAGGAAPAAGAAKGAAPAAAKGAAPAAKGAPAKGAAAPAAKKK